MSQFFYDFARTIYYAAAWAGAGITWYFCQQQQQEGRESKEMICSVECDCGQFQFSCDDQPRNDKQQEMNMFSLSGWYSSSLWGFNVTIRVVQRVAGEAHSTNGDGKSFVVLCFFERKKEQAQNNEI